MNEKEVIFETKTSFKVLEVENQTSKTLIILEEIDNE